MRIVSLAAGTEDYGRKQMLRVTLLGVSLAVGHTWLHWLGWNVDVEWPHWWCYSGGGWVKKAQRGEQFFDMLLRRCAPGWLA